MTNPYIRKHLLCFIGIFGLLLSLGAQPVTTYNLKEVVVADVPWEKVLKQTTAKLSKGGADAPFYYGNGRYYQACYLGDSLVMTCDAYGWYTMWGLRHRDQQGKFVFRENKHLFHFNPVYHNTKLDSRHRTSTETPHEIPVLFYLDQWLYTQCYIYLPCFVPEKYYEYDFDTFDGRYYAIRFKTAKKYFPKRTPISMEGVLIIDSKDKELKSIRMNHIISCIKAVIVTNDFGVNFPFKYKQQAYTEELTINFSHSGIITEMEHRIVWNLEEDRQNGILSLAKPLHAGFDYQVPYSVVEYWKSDSLLRSQKRIRNNSILSSIDDRPKQYEFRSQMAPDVLDRLEPLGINSSEKEKMANGNNIRNIRVVLPSENPVASVSLKDTYIAYWQPLLFREP